MRQTPAATIPTTRVELEPNTIDGASCLRFFSDEDDLPVGWVSQIPLFRKAETSKK